MQAPSDEWKQAFRAMQSKFYLAIIAAHRWYTDDILKDDPEPTSEHALKKAWVTGLTLVLVETMRNVAIALEHIGASNKRQFRQLVHEAVAQVEREWDDRLRKEGN